MTWLSRLLRVLARTDRSTSLARLEADAWASLRFTTS